MKPFTFSPIFKSLIWGGDKIAPYKGIESSQRNIGESWELSGVEGSESVVSGGEFDGWLLPELTARFKEKLVGRKAYEAYGDEFPILVKFIDARRDLSIQVHPDDELARRREGKRGKTEMWYVVGADADTHLKCGFSQRITPEEYEARVADSTIVDVLQDYVLTEGDVFFLPAGRVHAIGAGALIAEIQQTSDITYRIYDYNRTDANGRQRELHTALAREAIDYTVLPDYRTRYDVRPDGETVLVECPHFTTSLYDLTVPCGKEVAALDSFLAVICIGGEGELCDSEGNITPLRQGRTVLVPASTERVRFVPKGGVGMKLLTCHM